MTLLVQQNEQCHQDADGDDENDQLQQGKTVLRFFRAIHHDLSSNCTNDITIYVVGFVFFAILKHKRITTKI